MTQGPCPGCFDEATIGLTSGTLVQSVDPPATPQAHTPHDYTVSVLYLLGSIVLLVVLGDYYIRHRVEGGPTETEGVRYWAKRLWWVAPVVIAGCAFLAWHFLRGL